MTQALVERLREFASTHDALGMDISAALLSEAADALEAALTAAIGAGGQAVEAPAVNGGGSIKALEWTSHRGWPQTAKSVVGKYQIWAGKDLWLNDEQLPGDDDIGGVHYKSLDEAKAAAQRDYETRILSALER